MFRKEPSLHEQAEGLIAEINLAKEVADLDQHSSLIERVNRAKGILEGEAKARNVKEEDSSHVKGLSDAFAAYVGAIKKQIWNLK